MKQFVVRTKPLRIITMTQATATADLGRAGEGGGGGGQTYWSAALQLPGTQANTALLYSLEAHRQAKSVCEAQPESGKLLVKHGRAHGGMRLMSCAAATVANRAMAAVVSCIFALDLCELLGRLALISQDQEDLTFSF